MPLMALSKGGGGYHDIQFDEYDPTIEDFYEDGDVQNEFRALNQYQNSFSAKKVGKRVGFGLRRSSISPPPSPPALNIEVAQVIEV